MTSIFKNVPEPFEPKLLPFDLKDIITDIEIINLMTDASNLLGEYKGFLISTPNPMLLISPLLAQEAVISSKLEGTHAKLEDFLNFEAGVKTEIQKDELKEISNYREALYFALERMITLDEIDAQEFDNKLPLISRLIKEMHKILLNNVRGKTKNPGEFKRFQNYIGGSEGISYTPVSPSKTEQYMKNLEDYIHLEEKLILIQSAIIHAQFEMIHPFEDGNGRIGRLLIPLFFYYKNYLPFPTFYMSSYFEKNKSMYLEKLEGISKNNDWKSWIEYYLKGICEQAKLNTKKAFLLRKEYLEMKELILKSISSKFIIYFLDFIFIKPIFQSTHVGEYFQSKGIKIGKTTVQKLLGELVELKILNTSDNKRNKIYYCPSILLNTGK